MPIEPAAAASRAARRVRRVGEGSICEGAGCGESDPRVLEVHHVAGRANDPKLTQILCRNCHRRMTVKHADLGVDMKQPETVLDLIIAVLRGCGTTVAGIAETLLWCADLLEFLLVALDTFHPQWRQMIAATRPAT